MKKSLLLLTLVAFYAGCAHNAGRTETKSMTLADRGVARAVIVVDKNATESERYAAEELSRFLKEVTGATFTVGTSASGQKNRILVGPGAARQADPSFNTNGLSDEGIVIQTRGNDLILAGGAARGTIYAVYTFLEDHIGCRWWSSKVSTIPNRPTLTLGSLNTRYTPPLEWRETFWFDAFDGDWSARNKNNGNACRLEKKHGGKYVIDTLAHTFNLFIPPDKYFKDHPEWFSEIGGKRIARSQLCLTNEEMRQEFVKNLKERQRKNPDAVLASISQNDWFRNCQCSKCAELDKKEGSASGSLLHFVNAVAADMEKEFPNVGISTLAYQYTRKPPRFVKPRHNVIIVLCSIECSFSKPLSDDRNSDFRDDIVGWSNICDHLYVWDYTTNFTNYIFPHPNLRVLGPNVKFLMDHHVRGVFEEGAYETPGAEMAELRAWVLAKLLWDPTLDTQALINEFAHGYYGPAADEILAYINLMHDKVEAGGDWLGCFSPDAMHFLTFETLSAAWQHLKAAEKTVQDSPDLRSRVQVAQLPVLNTFMRRWDFLQIKARWTGADWPVDDSIEANFNQFMAIAKANDINRLSEGDSKFVALEKIVGQLKQRQAGVEETVQDAFEKSMNHFQEKRYSEAISGFQKIFQSMPDENLGYTSAYNAACAFALMGDKEQALKWLKTSMQHGFTNLEHIQADDDLKILRDDPEFKKLIKKEDK